MAHRLNSSYLQMDEEEHNTPRLPGCSRPPRRCYTSISESNPRGSYYPNYQTCNNSLTGLSRPTHASGYIDASLDDVFNDDMKAKVNSILPATGIVYTGVGGPGHLDGSGPWAHSDACTWWLLEHNGHFFGVTSLQPFQLAPNTKIYINTTLSGNDKSERASFHRQDVNVVDFVEVKLRADLVAIRERYIRNLHTTRDETKALENIDPEYQLQHAITCNIAFLDLEGLSDDDLAKLAERPRLKIASAPPNVGAFDVAIGYHHGGPWNQKELEDEFAATIVNPPPPGVLYFADVRSVSLGVVKGVGTGIITDISTMEAMSSGCPKLVIEEGELRVFGIAVGSYNDQPSPESATDWALLREASGDTKLDIKLPEAGRSTSATAKNRNIILSFHHPCVAEMLCNL